MANTYVVWHDTTISKADRTRLNGHKSAVLWFTGLSGAGKSTLANALEKYLHELGVHTYLLDGDNIRHGINRDLGFSPQDRTENIRRIGEVARLFVDAGVIVLTAFISPFQADRELARSLVAEGEFIEIHLDCSLEACEQRDPKGLYQKARNGEIKEFTGISSPYEAPLQPELTIRSDQQTISESVAQIARYLEDHGYLHV